jgi:hypothetical protein
VKYHGLEYTRWLWAAIFGGTAIYLYVQMDWLWASLYVAVAALFFWWDTRQLKRARRVEDGVQAATEKWLGLPPDVGDILKKGVEPVETPTDAEQALLERFEEHRRTCKVCNPEGDGLD